MAKKKSAFDRVPQRSLNIDQLNTQALAHLQQGQFQAGADLLRQSLAKNSRQPEAYYNFGFALQQQGLLDSAIQAYSQCISMVPDDAEALMARGFAFATQMRFEEAAKDYAKSASLIPDNPNLWNDYGNALLAIGQESQAINAYDNSLKLRPNFSKALYNKAKALQALESYDDAAELNAAALAVDPNYEAAKFNLSWVKLLLGDFTRGWSLFESRWTVAELGNQRRFGQLRQWLGQESISGKSLLVYNEQGLGDTLQFCRYVPQLQAMGAKVSLAVQAPLASLLADQWPGVTVAESFADLSDFDLATPLMSLPFALGTTLETIPADIPYIRVLASTPPIAHDRLRVGIVWSGSTQHKNDKNRSMSLAALAPLFDLPADWICLQPDIREADLAWLAVHPEVRLERPVLNDFVETANLIAGLDLVVTVDTSVAHLAGAMGKPVWIMLPTGCDYRWLLEREDSPWYPTARLFRQTERGNWADVVLRVTSALKTFSAARTGT